MSADRSAGTPSRWRFAYDPAGNRTGDQADDAAMGASHNNLNQLLTRQPGGVLAFKGTTNEPASVTVAGKDAQTASDNSFSSQASVGTGTTDVAVTATDPSGNVRTNTYRVSASGTGATYTYDPNGNLATKTEGADNWTYEWNARNELTRVLKNGVEAARFSYDPLGRRVERVAGGVTTSFTYQVADILREVRDSTTLKYVHDIGVDAPLLVDDTTGISYFYADGLASVSKIINQAGVATLEREYDPWGNLQSGSSQPGYAFTGREWDPETGLYYYRARYYDPATGRFVSEDPIRFDAGPNFYLYVDANPVTGTDPLGLWGQYSEPRVPRPPRKPPRDWCGSRGTEWIPDYTWPYYDFTEPCEIHDKCYETCGKSKAQCDFEFLQNMQKKCRWKPPFMGCSVMGAGYYTGVVTEGGEAYDEAQKKRLLAISRGEALAKADRRPGKRHADGLAPDEGTTAAGAEFTSLPRIRAQSVVASVSCRGSCPGKCVPTAISRIFERSQKRRGAVVQGLTKVARVLGPLLAMPVILGLLWFYPTLRPTRIASDLVTVSCLLVVPLIPRSWYRATPTRLAASTVCALGIVLIIPVMDGDLKRTGGADLPAFVFRCVEILVIAVLAVEAVLARPARQPTAR